MTDTQKAKRDMFLQQSRTLLRSAPEGLTFWTYLCECDAEIFGTEQPDSRASSGRAIEFYHSQGTFTDALAWDSFPCPKCGRKIQKASPKWERICSGRHPEEPAFDLPLIFVFGSNLAGIHGAGAARFAHKEQGAEWGVGRGRTGNCYAIPTKDGNIKTLQIELIAFYVGEFIKYAKNHPRLHFRVTRIGCGLAGYTDADIAPLFEGAPHNCELPDGWRNLCASIIAAHAAGTTPA